MESIEELVQIQDILQEYPSEQGYSAMPNVCEKEVESQSCNSYLFGWSAIEGRRKSLP